MIEIQITLSIKLSVFLSFIGVNDRNTDNFIDEHNGMLKNETFIGGGDPEGEDNSEFKLGPQGDETPSDENQIDSEILEGREEGTGKTTGNKGGIATSNVRAEFCKSIVERGSIKTGDIHTGELINSCGSF